MPLASLTSSVTSAVATHGLWAVFALMLVDAVFPAASELVMVYAGAVGAGAFAGVQLTLFGHAFSSGFEATSPRRSRARSDISLERWLAG